MKEERRELLKLKLRTAKHKFLEGSEILKDISNDSHNSEELKDKISRIIGGVEIDIEEISRIKKWLKHE